MKETNGFQKRLFEVLDRCDRSEQEQETLVRLMCLFASLDSPPDPAGLMDGYEAAKKRFMDAADGSSGETLEEAFLNLYCLVHGHEAPYTREERKQVDATGGYWCHAGGLSPILKAGQFIRKDTVFADYGAGNGLQGLLVQKLWPHKKTVQIEISSKMVEAGKALEEWLGIPPERVEWVTGDVSLTPPVGMNFIYMYRPLKPVGPGVAFYENFAREVALSDGRIIIFSIADCLKDYLPKSFEIFYSDGHLTCFSNEKQGR